MDPPEVLEVERSRGLAVEQDYFFLQCMCVAELVHNIRIQATYVCNQGVCTRDRLIDLFSDPARHLNLVGAEALDLRRATSLSDAVVYAIPTRLERHDHE